MKLNRIDYKYLKALRDREKANDFSRTKGIREWSGITDLFKVDRLLPGNFIQENPNFPGKFILTFEGHVALAAYLAKHPDQ
uniref:Uncharacterized protein n=1 Tax=viral metagenome TaxID=1070528 RepID=A0A6M3IZ46_9ZZZZ